MMTALLVEWPFLKPYNNNKKNTTVFFSLCIMSRILPNFSLNNFKDEIGDL